MMQHKNIKAEKEEQSSFFVRYLLFIFITFPGQQ